MFGVLIVVLSADGITDLGFSTRKCHDTAHRFFARFEISLARHARRSTSTGWGVLATVPARIGAHA
jgi:hypothetical protein